VSLLDEQIRKARERARGIDPAGLVATDPATPPSVMASPDALADRRRLLAQTHGEDYSPLAFERLIAGDELQPVNYLAHGVVAARPVCRLVLNDSGGRLCGYATGFLFAPGVLLTNNHVFPNAASARLSLAEFDDELDVFDQPKVPVAFTLDPDQLFLTSPALDYALVAVEPRGDGGKPLADYGYLPLVDSPGKVVEGEWMTIIQHPAGGRKQVCVRENKLLTRTNDALWYSTDTLGGSSGSPVFNNDWQVVALHHKGVPETKDGKIQAVDGRDFDDRPSQQTDQRRVE
jgi:endonuclease G